MWAIAGAGWIAGGLVTWAGGRGLLGWRLRDRRTAVTTGLAIALLGPHALRYAIEGIAGLGFQDFVVTTAVVAGAAVIAYRWLDRRSRVGARVAVAVCGLAVVAPSVLVGLIGPWLGLAVPAAVLVGWYRLSR